MGQSLSLGFTVDARNHVAAGSLFDLDKVIVRRAAIQRCMGPQIVVEELVLKELGRDVGDGERAVVSVPELDSGGGALARCAFRD